MGFINLNSNRGLVNLLADYIMIEISEKDKYDTIIEVTDCGRFFVFNGMTSRKDLLNISDLLNKFKTEYESLVNSLGYDNFNIIDLVIYDNQLIKKEEFWFDFYNTNRPIFSDKIINFLNSDLSKLKYQKLEDGHNLNVELDFSEENTNSLNYFTYTPMTISSEFPHGYSFNMGRNHYYYSEYVVNQLFTTLMCNRISFRSSTKINSDGDLNIEVLTNSIYSNDKIKSLILDVFNFDLHKFKKLISEYNYIEDLTKPLSEKPWLKKDQLKNIIMF